MRRLIITLKDIGFKRLYLRLKYEIIAKRDSSFPFLWMLFNKDALIHPHWLNFLPELSNHKLDSLFNQNSKRDINQIQFEFLNKAEKLNFPIIWNNNNWSRLWQFNLHYFDWARDSIELAFLNNSLDQKILLLDNLIDQWIEGNPPGVGDGWHSYTLSLRIRNWIFIFRTFPNMVNSYRLKSLWLQVYWLYKHPEICHGGNHWIENLTALIIGSSQFNNKTANKIYLKSIKLLKIALHEQILNDGGHEERSAAYHILILDRLVELGWIIQSIKKERPIWLVNYIKKMTNWINLIELKDGKIPLFNDSSIDICPNIKLTKEFSISYLRNEENSLSGIRRLLSKTKKLTKIFGNFEEYKYTISSDLTNLNDTGWLIIRPNYGWELVFKYGQGSPNHLPAHSHSDLFSFDLFKNGIPVIVETGTSVYGNSKIRKYERSSAAHNVLRLSKLNKLQNKKIKWIEPVDVWGNFRAGRKAQVLVRSFKKVTDGNYSISASHDGFKIIGVKYERNINLNINKEGDIELSIKEKIICKNNLIGNQLFHLGPSLNPSLFKTNIKSSNQIKNIYRFWIDTHFAVKFGKIIPRKTFISSFILPKGRHAFEIKIFIPNKDFEL